MTETEQVPPSIETLSRQELEQRLESALQTIDRLQQIRQSMGEFFLFLIGHQMGIPFTSILGFSELLLEERERTNLTEEQQKKFLARIRKDAKVLLRTRKLATALIALDANVAGSRDDLPIVEVDLQPTINHIVGMFEEMELAVALPNDLPKVQIPVTVLHYILIGTLTMLGTPERSNHNTIAGSVEGEWVSIRITNPNSDISRFPTLKDLTDEDPILSLFDLNHLASCRYLLNRYGGQMCLEPQKESGVIITFNLPMHKGSLTE